jgi:hypothetical protein
VLLLQRRQVGQALVVRFFGNEELIVELNGTQWIWASASARSREAFDELESLVLSTGFSWEWSSDD